MTWRRRLCKRILYFWRLWLRAWPNIWRACSLRSAAHRTWRVHNKCVAFTPCTVRRLVTHKRYSRYFYARRTWTPNTGTQRVSLIWKLHCCSTTSVHQIPLILHPVLISLIHKFKHQVKWAEPYLKQSHSRQTFLSLSYTFKRWSL